MTLTSAPLAPLLERLFAQAEGESIGVFDSVPAADRDRMMHSKTEYRHLYGLLKDAWIPVSRETGALLYMLARSMGARTVVEYGTSFGISTLHLAAALRENGGPARLITCEFEPSKIARAQAHFAEAGLSDLIEVREGDALATLAADLPPTIDLVLLDGAKALYGDILALLEPALRPGALIVADNADHCPDYVARVRAPGGGYLSVPFAHDVELSIRI
jgi:predicted O-methyltransferase YrrM